MKRNLSVFMLTVRAKIYKLLCLSLVFLPVFSVYFYFSALSLYKAEGLSPHLLFMKTGSVYICILYLVLIFLSLVFNFNGKNSKSVYTIKRLGVTENAFFLWDSLSNFLMLIISLSAVLTAGLIAAGIYKSIASELFTDQTAFLFFYRSDFFNNLFPLFSPVKGIRNIIILISLSLCFAEGGAVQRRGKKSVIAVISVFAFLPVLWLDSGDKDLDIVFILLSAVMALISSFNALRRDKNEE